MNLKDFFGVIKKGIREGIERLDDKTLTNNVLNNVVNKAYNKLYGDMVVSETQAEIEYAYTNYYIEQLLSDMQELALMTAKYSNQSSSVTSTGTDAIAPEASKFAKDLEKIAKAAAKKIVSSVNSEVEVNSQRAVLENIYSTVEALIVKFELAINQTDELEAKFDARTSELNEYNDWAFAADASKKAFYEKADEAQALEEELPAIELRLRQY